MTIHETESLDLVRSQLTVLAEACASFSSTQVQSMGTLGGNLGNASPAADTAPALIVLEAELELAGPDGRRRLPVAEFFRGPGRTALAAGELITAVIVPDPGPGTGSAFLKLGRVSNDIAKASAAVTVVREGGRVVDCRLAFGSVGPTPMRTRAAEKLVDRTGMERGTGRPGRGGGGQRDHANRRRALDRPLPAGYRARDGGRRAAARLAACGQPSV